MSFFPLVGLAIGILMALAYWLLSFLLPGPLVLWIVIGLLVFVTGGLHLDGLADTLDGLAGGGPREKILEVMRDSRIGAFGVIGLIFVLGGKYLALDAISEAALPYSLVLMAVMGRSAMVLVCCRSPYARSGDGLGRPFSQHLTRREVVISSVSAFVIASVLMGFRGVLTFIGTLLFSLGFRLFFLRRLGGVTGDILGAADEAAELFCLLLIILMERASG
jgi:adenosylcobinamide-GDP ribazoletransferase